MEESIRRFDITCKCKDKIKNIRCSFKLGNYFFFISLLLYLFISILFYYHVKNSSFNNSLDNLDNRRFLSYALI